MQNTPSTPKKVLSFRYFCDACTNRAFYSATAEVFKERVCQKCGAKVAYKSENYFEMSPESDEFKKINLN